MRTILSLLAIIAFAAALAVYPTAATAAPEGEATTRIEIESESLGEGTLELTGDLEVGEVRDLWTDSGERIEITRTEDGYSFDVAGEEIAVRLGAGGELVRIAGIGSGGDAVVAIAGGEAEGGAVVSKTLVISTDEDEGGVTVSSGAVAGEKAEGKKIATRVQIVRPEGEGKAVVIGGGDDASDEVSVFVHSEEEIELEPDPSHSNLVLVKRIRTGGEDGEGEPVVIKIERRVKKD